MFDNVMILFFTFQDVAMYNLLARKMETALIWDLDVTESTTVRIEVMSLIVVSNPVTL